MEYMVIIDYGLGNLGSIINMFRKIGVESTLSSEPSVIEKADKLVLPGVGSFDSGMKNLQERGLVPILNKKVVQEKTPILGVCLGMQLMGKRSEEGSLPGLGWIDAQSIRFGFNGDDAGLRIPHMGWNMLSIPRPHKLFAGLEDENRYYFVHSFHMVCSHEENILARTRYGFPFTSAVVKGNIIGVQFHPEKSHKFGMRLLKNFSEWDCS